jgi:uncharacterized membrane-anchored protein
LVIALFIQFRSSACVPGIYWLAAVLVSVMGTLIADNPTDNYGIAPEITASMFAFVLAATFGAWYVSEENIAVHTIDTTRREAFYWPTMLIIFAFGTATSDLAAERFQLGNGVSALLFAGLIAVVALAQFRFGLNRVLAFWIAYVLTRPLGASLGDYLSLSRDDGGLGLGTAATSGLLLVAILAAVAYLTFTKRDNARLPGASA